MESGDDVRKLLGPVFVCMAGSVIVFSTASDMCHSSHFEKCSDKDYSWAIACGVISALLCLLRLVLGMPQFRRPLPSVSVGFELTTDMMFSVFLVIWWSLGAAVNTRNRGIFPNTNNGYFATWISFFAAATYAAKAWAHLNHVDRLTSAAKGHAKGIFLILVASVVEFSVAGEKCHDDKKCNKRFGFAVAVGVISTIVCLVHILLTQCQPALVESMGRTVFNKALGTVLVVMWAIGAGVNTSSKGPFTSSCVEANGYFATWVAFFASLYLAGSVFLGDDDESEIYADDKESVLPYQQAGTYQQVPSNAAPDVSKEQQQQPPPEYSYQNAPVAASQPTAPEKPTEGSGEPPF
eukprot:m.478871 g.478871  ORF g.478871 m.478871 type:complete len:351 (-) comp21255_c0_seq1:381-1433(-)